MISLQNWGFIRIVRLVAGSYLLWNAVADHQLLIGLMGGFLVIQSILNTGCGAGGCGIAAPTKSIAKPTNQVDYEEVR